MLIDKAAKVCKGRKRLAERLGVHPANVTQWAQGDKSCPPRHAAAIAVIAGERPEVGVMAAVERKLKIAPKAPKQMRLALA
jgi:hypothetical protein